MKTIYVCQHCGEIHAKWMGKCTSCGTWNSLLEEKKEEKSKSGKPKTNASKRLEDFAIYKPSQPLDQKETPRIYTNIQELDTVLGGGIVPGSFALLWGDPGIGKSTMVLHIADTLGKQGKTVLYISWEESLNQIGLRAQRLGIHSDNISIVSETQLENIELFVQNSSYDFVVVDSIQTIYSQSENSFPGSVTQIRTCAQSLMDMAKKSGTPIMTIGHVTKDGNLAGPKILEHLVDAVLYLEGEENQDLRILRSIKNRYGSTRELGIFAMNEDGLTEVKNPSEAFLDKSHGNKEGFCISAIMEGNRALLLEIQALTVSTNFGYPKRTASGLDLSRLQLLVAVLQKHARLRLDSQDVYANVAGGFRLQDPSVDLALAFAIFSSMKHTTLSQNALAFGEIGLSGEVRKVKNIETRIKEAEKLGFDTIYTPKLLEKPKTSLTIVELSHVSEIEGIV